MKISLKSEPAHHKTHEHSHRTRKEGTLTSLNIEIVVLVKDKFPIETNQSKEN